MSRFPGGYGQHIANPRTPAQGRANNVGGLSKDDDSGSVVAGHTALFAGALVKQAIVTAQVSAAVKSGNNITFGSGAATIYDVTVPNGITPQLRFTLAQTVRNSAPDIYPVGAYVWVVFTGQFYLIVSPVGGDTITLASLLPVIPAPVTGSRANTEQALKNLLAALAPLGIIDDQTTV